jgi:DNA processing protein
MKPVEQGAEEPVLACASCLRRSWLLAEMSALLDYARRQEGRLIGLLALDDEKLLQALGGTRKMELKARYAQFNPDEIPRVDGVTEVCRHDRRFPDALNGAAAPRMLNVAGGVERLHELTASPVVAIVGSRSATDYGLEMAKSLARGLVASGVTVACGLADGIALAAQTGALEVGGRVVVVVGGGLDVAFPTRRRALCERVRRSGCAVAELPCGSRAWPWGRVASGRIVAALAELSLVVEAGEDPGELADARMAQALGRTVAAMPGRVTSPASSGAHALLLDGAHLVRGPADVLELLYATDTPRSATDGARTELEHRLKTTLERVGAGSDTPEKLMRDGAAAGEVLLALSELELLGLLARGDGGRYVPRDALHVG